MYAKFSAVFLCLTVAGCSVIAKTPMTRFESPEARGKLAFDGQVGYQGRNEIKLSEDFTRTPPDMTNPSIDAPGHRLMAHGSLGVIPQLDLNLTLPEGRAGFKWQVMGAPKEAAEGGNVPVSLYGGVAIQREEANMSSAYSSQMVQYELKELQFDIGVVAGYRFGQSTMLYSGPFVLWDKMRTRYQPHQGAYIQEQTGTARSIGWNLGIQLESPALYFRGEIAATKTKMGSANVGRATYGMALGKYF